MWFSVREGEAFRGKGRYAIVDVVSEKRYRVSISNKREGEEGMMYYPPN